MIRDDYAAPCVIGGCDHSADHGAYTCTRCTQRLQTQLAEIPEYAAALTAEPVRSGGNERHAPGFRSQPPARLDVISALDYRSVSHELGPDDADGAEMSILATLHHVAEWVAVEAHVPRASHTPTIAGEAAFLRTMVTWCTGQQWVNELAENVGKLHSQCQRLAGDPPEKPWAVCGCGGPLWSRGEQTIVAIRCSWCGTTYSGAEILRVVSEGAA